MTQDLGRFALLTGVVTHHRHDEHAHAFKHRQFWVMADVDALSDPKVDSTSLAGLWPWMGVHRPALYQFKAADHLPDDSGRDLKTKVLQTVEAQGVSTKETVNILLMCHWRYANYTFNPVSLFYGLDRAGVAQWCLLEVENTFYERKPFVIANSGTADAPRFEVTTPKHFYVSPFFQVNDTFHVSLPAPPKIGQPFGMTITTVRDNAPILTATFAAQCQPFTPKAGKHCLWKYAFMPQQVIGGIHLHAFKLWLQGVPFAQKNDFLENQQGVWNPRPPLTSFTI